MSEELVGDLRDLVDELRWAAKQHPVDVPTELFTQAADALEAKATVQGVNQQLLEALEFAQTFLRHEGRHADDCDIFDLDDEGRHRHCSCNLDALTADLDAAIAAAREGGKV